MTYLDLAESLVKQLEGCRLTGYVDSVGKATVGYGHTGPEVRVGQSITQEIADHDLLVDLATADQRLSEVCVSSALSALHDHERAALVSFVFNVGAGPGWTIWKDINAGNLTDVPTQLRRFVNGLIDGREQVIPGLEHRREAEITYWNTGDLTAVVLPASVAVAAMPPSSLTRNIITPPTPTPAPPGATASLTAKVVTAAAGIGATAAQVHDVVAPHAVESPIFAHLAVGCSLVIVAAACIGIIIHTHQAEARHS